MPKLESIKKTRFFHLCMEHPYALAFGCGFLVLGAATGMSTSAVLARSGLIMDCAQRATQSVHLLSGFLRVALFNLMLCCGVLICTVQPSAFPLSCICLALKGFALGFAVRQLYMEYAWWGVTYGVLGVLLPSFCMLTGMTFCFSYGLSQLPVLQKQEKSREKNSENVLEPCIQLTIFLTLLGTLLEGIVAQVILRLLLT